MDEKEKIKSILKLIGIYIIMIAIAITPFVFLLSVITGLGFREFIKGISSIYIIFFIIIGGFGLTYFLIYFFNRKKKEVNEKGYFRNISEIKYGPAIASILLDENIEVAKDYTATIIDLCRKKYIQMEKNNEEYKFYLINDSIINLSEHERYVIKCIIENEKFDDEIFKQKVEDDAIKLNYLKGKKKRPVKVIGIQLLKIFICAMIYSFIPEDTMISNIVGGIGFILELSFFVIIFKLIISRRNLERTYKGMIEAQKWKKFKNFIKEYTLISEKNIEHVALFEEYLSFAIAVGEAKQIEKFVIKDEAYRELIYKDLR